MNAIKSGKESPDYEATVIAVLTLRPESDKETTDTAIRTMVRAIVEAGPTPSQKMRIFAQLDEKATDLSVGKTIKKTDRTRYIAKEIRDATFRLKEHLNPSPLRKPKDDLLSKYYPRTPEAKDFDTVSRG